MGHFRSPEPRWARHRQTGAETGLFERRARRLSAEHGIAVSRAEVTDSPERARDTARRPGGRTVVKSQVRTGGRGKAGGVVRTADPAAARRVLGMEVKGRTAAAVMVAEPVDVESESRVSCVPGPGGGRLPGRRPRRGRHGDRGGRGPAPRGGARVAVEPAEKMTTWRRPGWRKRPARPRRPPTSSYGWGEALVREDARLVEVDPLVRTARAGPSPSTARSPWTTTPSSGTPVGERGVPARRSAGGRSRRQGPRLRGTGR
ncbi:hypothetical protein GCM10010240_32010 [Streptomyces griseoviridis]|nr:hypothetical protein GCM10010240_32010 [Streptomyces griseoviridis]